jgi:hypothetical protein
MLLIEARIDILKPTTAPTPTRLCSSTLSARAMDQIEILADIIVPGHDNYFLNLNVCPNSEFPP